ncbi:MAG: GntR family transcriptional regulator [Betaproteobacteria bacterium]|nr:GntR family transcriptional regulator [Betaproteobacteria bacterium]
MNDVHSVILDKLRGPPIAGLPKYAQLRDALLAAIESGHFRPGAKLPTEVELARSTPFSLGTVQRALRALVEDGVVVRQQGAGTFVTHGRKPMDEPWHCRFLDDDGKLLPVYPRIVLRRRVAERGPWSEWLDQERDNIVRIDRTISINAEFLVYSKFYLDGEKFPSLAKRPLAELDGANFKVILSREFNLPVTHVAQTVRCARFGPGICRAIEVKKGTVGTVIEIVASAGRERQVYYQELSVPPARRKLVMSDSYQARAWPV